MLIFVEAAKKIMARSRKIKANEILVLYASKKEF